ncbi:MAG TPA: hypothetical protein VFX70_19885 [Mycobacteriales bacterium]|nr:hypothetical protein [Mycobacteriales bacterium]
MTDATELVDPTPLPLPDPGPPPPGREERRSSLPTVLAGVLAVLAVALVAFSGYLVLATRQEAATQARRQDVLSAARTEAVNLTSQDYSTIDRDLNRMIGGTTGDLKKDLGKQRGQYRDTFVKGRLRARGSATEAALVTMRDRVATVLVVVDQVVRSDAKNSQVEPRHYRLELDMSHVDGRWLASGLRAAGLVS